MKRSPLLLRPLWTERTGSTVVRAFVRMLWLASLVHVPHTASHAVGTFGCPHPPWCSCCCMSGTGFIWAACTRPVLVLSSSICGELTVPLASPTTPSSTAAVGPRLLIRQALVPTYIAANLHIWRPLPYLPPGDVVDGSFSSAHIPHHHRGHTADLYPAEVTLTLWTLALSSVIP